MPMHVPLALVRGARRLCKAPRDTGTLLHTQERRTAQHNNLQDLASGMCATVDVFHALYGVRLVVAF